MPYAYLLFDADHTLLDFRATARKAFFHTMRYFGIECDDAHFAHYEQLNHHYWQAYESGRIDERELRLGRWQAFFELLREWRDPAEVNECYIEAVSRSAILLEGARPLLDRLKGAGWRMALVTNGLSQVQRPRLRHSGIETYFDFVVISDEVGSAKPQRAFFDHAFRQMEPVLARRPHPEEVLVIGDSLEADIKGGRDYGCHTCWYNPEGKPRPRDIEPNYEVHRLEAVADLLGA